GQIKHRISGKSLDGHHQLQPRIPNMSTREAPEKDVSLRYIHPPGERFFSAGVLAFCGFLATVQAILIPIFAEQGLGYQYVFACVVLVHVYIYQRAWQLTRKDRSVPADLFSLVEGYF